VVVGSLRVELHVPASRSLKAKRAEIRPIVDGVRHRFPVAVAEVAHQDTWQRATLGFAAVAATPGRVTELLDEVERFVWSRPGVEVIDSERTWIDLDATADGPGDPGDPVA